MEVVAKDFDTDPHLPDRFIDGLAGNSELPKRLSKMLLEKPPIDAEVQLCRVDDVVVDVRHEIREIGERSDSRRTVIAFARDQSGSLVWEAIPELGGSAIAIADARCRHRILCHRDPDLSPPMQGASVLVVNRAMHGFGERGSVRARDRR